MHCSCGFQFEVLTNARKYKRKKTHLVGRYQPPTQADKTGDMVVKNLSFGGVNFHTSVPHTLAVGDQLSIDFTLDEDSEARVEAHILIRYVNGEVIGAAYTTDNTFDSALAAYLLR
ncbi:hypothetical protein C2W62_30290 [Candidatus Entotheonella serta]|nr:hypothetical protein C2W62_30290 [Candidatus Entotheonella serta]